MMQSNSPSSGRHRGVFVLFLLKTVVSSRRADKRDDNKSANFGNHTAIMGSSGIDLGIEKH